MGDDAITSPERRADGVGCVNCGYSRAGIAAGLVCPECGCDPLVTAGDSDGLVGLIATDDAAEAGIMSSRLGAVGIRADTATAGSVFTVRVRRADFRAARAALVAAPRDPGPIDWDSLGLGDIADEFVDDRGRCLRCGYDVTKLPDARRCPECGGPLCPDAAREDGQPHPTPRIGARLWAPQTVLGFVLAAALGCVLFAAAALIGVIAKTPWYDWVLVGVPVGLGLAVVAVIAMAARAVVTRRNR